MSTQETKELASEVVETTEQELEEVKESEVEAEEQEEAATEESTEEVEEEKEQPVTPEVVEKVLEESQEKGKYERDRLHDLSQELSEEQTALKGKFQGYSLNGKPIDIYEMTDKEFRQVVRDVYKLKHVDTNGLPASNSDAINDGIVDELEHARESYMTKYAPIARAELELQQRKQKAWTDEWSEVEGELLKLYPAVEKHRAKINEFMAQDFERKTLVARLEKGPVEKFKYALDVLKKLNINVELEKDHYRKAREANLEQSLGKGSQAPMNKGKPKAFTRAQIAAMSIAEFSKNEKLIEQQIKKGLIK